MDRELTAKLMTRSFVLMAYLLVATSYSKVLPIRHHQRERAQKSALPMPAQLCGSGILAAAPLLDDSDDCEIVRRTSSMNPSAPILIEKG